MKLKFLAVFVIATQITYSQNLFTKGISKLAKMVGGMNTVTVSSLDEVVPTVGIGSNLHPVELGSMDQTLFNNWKSGGDMVAVGLSKKSDQSFCKVDGSVTIDGKPAEYALAGTYYIITEPSSAPRKVEVTTLSGQKSSFMIEPYKKPITLLSINGQKENVSLDLSKDVTIELESAPGFENAMLKVSIAINQLSIKSQYAVCYIRNTGSKITIPAAAFRNLNLKPGGDLLYSYKKSFLSVGIETMENATSVEGKFQDVKYTKSYDDGKFITVSTEPNLNKGLTFKGSDKDIDMDYEFYKPNAFLSRPYNQIKKVGVTSFSIRGTTYKEYSETSTSSNTLNMGGISNTTTTTTTKTTILEFPKQPDAVWDALLEKLYPEFMAVVKSEFNADDILVDKVTGTDAYKLTQAFSKDDKNTKVEFARSFRNTKVLSAFMPLSEGYGVNGVSERIMKESGADALMTITLDLEIKEGKDEKVLMTPKLAFEITGKTNGTLSNTKYCTGKIQSTTGVSFTKDITPAQLESIVRKSDMLIAFRKGLQELKAEEKANGDYETVWNLQK